MLYCESDGWCTAGFLSADKQLLWPVEIHSSHLRRQSGYLLLHGSSNRSEWIARTLRFHSDPHTSPAHPFCRSYRYRLQHKLHVLRYGPRGVHGNALHPEKQLRIPLPEDVPAIPLRWAGSYPWCGWWYCQKYRYHRVPAYGFQYQPWSFL